MGFLNNHLKYSQCGGWFSPGTLHLQVFHWKKKEVSFGFAGIRENKCLWLPSDFTLPFFSFFFFHLAQLLRAGLAGTQPSALSFLVSTINPARGEQLNGL